MRRGRVHWDYELCNEFENKQLCLVALVALVGREAAVGFDPQRVCIDY